MTQSGFEKRLLDLLPPLYQETDTAGDLRTFLKLPAGELDRLKLLADRFPEIFDIDRCEPRFVPLLASLVGWPYDPTKDVAPQRRAIREAVEFYRRKATIPAIHRSLTEIGWEGWIEETWPQAFRLNRRARLNGKKLPGEIFSYGAYRVHSTDPVPNILDALRVHHPAGTRAFFLTALQMTGDLGVLLEGFTKRIIWLLATARLHEVFTLNRSKLNGPDPLTQREIASTLFLVALATYGRQGFESAAVCIRRWQARMPGFRLNQSHLNDDHLVYAWVSERVAAICCSISVDDPPVPIPVAFRLNKDVLNHGLLGGFRDKECRVRFRKGDFFADADKDAPETLGESEAVDQSLWARHPGGLELGWSSLGGEEAIAPVLQAFGEIFVLEEEREER
jgi:phage tail-like protein